MSKFAPLAMLFAAFSALAQTPQKESDVLQSLLAEVRQLRQAIEAMTVASQRAQIALFTLQMQDSAVARTSQRLEEVRNRCRGEDANRQRQGLEIQNLETSLASGNLPEAQAKSIQASLTQRKSSLEAQATVVQACQASEAEVSIQLRNDQAKLAELQDRIERLDKSLEQLSGSGR